MIPVFETNFAKIVERIEAIDPIKYGKTRNFINGDVTYLSPYISRGVISVNDVKNSILKRGYKPYQVKKFIQELAWREYFQRVWQAKGDFLFSDLKNAQEGVSHYQMPSAIVEAQTGIQAIDHSINELYRTGYMHNHFRMYLASIATNIGKAHWSAPATWMYYHLLDGDLASNTCSWQWVCGAFSSKKYYCNQENINKYTGSTQVNSFLSKSYDELPELAVPEALKAAAPNDLTTPLPINASSIKLDSALPILVYNHYNLDPNWRINEDANRILLLEPSHFKMFPVSELVVRFIINLSKNIPNCQVFVGDWSEFKRHLFNSGASLRELFFKEHPNTEHWEGNKDSRDWMFPMVTGYFPSFFSYWKKSERYL